MREQVVGHKVGNRSGLGSHRRSGAATQKPARRESSGQALAARVRALLGYLPALLKLALAVTTGILIFAGYRAAASASFFQVRKVEVRGASRVSVDEVQAVVRSEVENTGVWNADLEGINARLEKMPWVRTAVVSRVLPDDIRIRITERAPRAVVRTASGRFRWVDEDAVLLGEMLPSDQVPAFFMRGLNEDDPEGARIENRDRVAKFLQLQQEWSSAGLAERVSEVNLIDLKDIRAQLAGEDAHIEVRLGSQDHGKRLKDALEVLDAQRQTPRGSLISYIDLSLGKRAIVGLTSGAHAGDTAELPALSNSSSLKKSDAGATTSQARISAAASKNVDTRNRKDNPRLMSEPEKKLDTVKKSDRQKQ